MSVEPLKLETRLVHGSKGYDEHTGAISFPIYQSATFRHPGLHQTTGYDYSRLQNPTREELENTLALLEDGAAGFAFSTGVAAVSAALSYYKPGDHLIVSDDLYGGTYRLFTEIFSHYGITASFTDTSWFPNIEKALQQNTKAIFLETPSNPLMKVTDIEAVVQFAREHRLQVLVDNTFLSPYYQRPLTLGADIVLHSGTKFLGGHNDTLAGLAVVRDAKLAEHFKFMQKAGGAVLAPFDSWLILRGIKTLAVRMDRQQQTAIKMAEFLKTLPEIDKVYYTGLPEHKGHEISKKQSSGFGSMISFTVKKLETVEKLLNGVRVIAFAESLGGVESLITYPHTQTHAEIPHEVRSRIGVTEKLLRLSIGLEDVQDLINDFERAIR